MKIDFRRIYRFEPVPMPPDGALPKGGDIYYECQRCGDIVSSITHAPASCACGNLEGAQGAVTIKDVAQITPLRGRLK